MKKTFLLIIATTISITTMAQLSTKEASKQIVTRFFAEVWNTPFRLETIDELVIEDGFKITTDGKDSEGRENFKKWIQGLQYVVSDLKVEVKEMMVTDDGTRVISRIVTTGKNQGMFGTKADNAPIELHLISILAIENGKIIQHWVERSSYELHERLTSKKEAKF